MINASIQSAVPASQPAIVLSMSTNACLPVRANSITAAWRQNQPESDSRRKADRQTEEKWMHMHAHKLPAVFMARLLTKSSSSSSGQSIHLHLLFCLPACLCHYPHSFDAAYQFATRFKKFFLFCFSVHTHFVSWFCCCCQCCLLAAHHFYSICAQLFFILTASGYLFDQLQIIASQSQIIRLLAVVVVVFSWVVFVKDCDEKKLSSCHTYC